MKIYISYSFSVLFVFFLIFSAFSQTADELSAARNKKLGLRYELAGDKYSAIEQYSAFLKKKPENRYYLNKVAHLYLETRNYLLAEIYFEKALKLSPHPKPELMFSYARVLKMNGKYEEARKVFASYRKKVRPGGRNEVFRKQAKIEIEGCDLILDNLLNDTTRLTEIRILDTTVNKLHTDFAPFPIDEKSFIYSSVRTDRTVYFSSVSESFSEYSSFYKAIAENGNWKGGMKLSDSFNLIKKNVGNAYICPHGNRIYFTVCESDENHQIICSIWYSEKNGNNWIAPVKLPKTINKPGTNNTQPAAGFEPRQNREVLYFVSNRKGGKGGLDIWYSILDTKTNEYTEPKNCGSKINTPMNEATPFIDLNTNKFYFSSDGLAGIGGYDVFSTVGALRKWEEPKNAGIPINSSADDLWYRTFPHNPDKGFIVSNRGRGTSMAGITCCDDIYEFTVKQSIFLKISGRVISFENLNKELYIEEFIDKPFKKLPSEGKLLDSATVSLFVVSGNEEILVKPFITNAEGMYLFRLEPGYSYKLTASKNGYFSSNYSLSTKNINHSDSFFHDFVLRKIPVKPLIVKNIYYLFDKYTLTDSAKAVIDSTIYQLMIENPEITVEISSHTDSKGSDSYNMTLSQKRAQSVVNYLIKKGISPDRLMARGYGESQPVAPNEFEDGSDNPEGRAKNRRTEFKVTGIKQDYQSFMYED